MILVKVRKASNAVGKVSIVSVSKIDIMNVSLNAYRKDVQLLIFEWEWDVMEQLQSRVMYADVFGRIGNLYCFASSTSTS